MSSLGRSLIVLGLVLVVLGLLVSLAPRLPWLGKLPGDIMIRRGNVNVYLPLATSLLLSLVFSVLLWLFRR